MKVVFPTNDQKNIAPKIGLAKGFLIIDTQTDLKKFIENERIKKIINKKEKLSGECGEHGLGIGQFLPKKLKELNVELFVAKFFGEGMLGNLDLYKIKTYITDKKDIKKVLEEIKEKYGN
ncbi:NifB/NifX family molybdenum-iron cluster-binding protein [Caminibacter sp.]